MYLHLLPLCNFFSQPFLAFCHHKIFQALLVHFLSHPWNQSFLQGTLVLSIGEWSGCQVWLLVLGYHCFSACVWIQLWTICMCIYTLHPCLSFSLYIKSYKFPVVLSITNKPYIGSSPSAWNSSQIISVIFSSHCFQKYFWMLYFFPYGKNIFLCLLSFIYLLKHLFFANKSPTFNTGPKTPPPTSTHRKSA